LKPIYFFLLRGLNSNFIDQVDVDSSGLVPEETLMEFSKKQKNAEIRLRSLSVQICNNHRVTFALFARQIKKLLDDPLYLQLKLKPYVFEILDRLIYQSKFPEIDSRRVNQRSLESTVATVLQLNVETASLLASLELDLTLSDPVRSFLIFIFVNIVTLI